MVVVVRHEERVCLENAGDVMDFIMAGFASLLLLAYLIYALVHPEKF